MAFEVRIASGKSAKLNIILCLNHFITSVFALYHPELNLIELQQSTDKSSVDCKVKNLLVLDDTEGLIILWSEL